MSGGQGANVVHLGVENELVEYLLASCIREGCGGLEGGVQWKRLATSIGQPRGTRITENGDEPRCLLASSDDPHVCTACRWLPATARRTGPPARPDSWSRLRVGVPHPPEQQPSRSRKIQAVSLLLTRKPIAVQSRVDGDGRYEREEPACSQKKGSGQVTGALGQSRSTWNPTKHPSPRLPLPPTRG